MSINRNISFTVSPSKTLLTGGTTNYQGHLQHNQVLDVDETRKRFAEYNPFIGEMCGIFLDSLASFMQKMAAEGCHLDFGPFTMGLTLRGGFPAANSPFDAERNAISMELVPSKKVKSAVASLRPINVTDDGLKSHIDFVWQESPYEAKSTIACSGERIILISGSNIALHDEAEDEGVWIESDTKEKLISGTAIESDMSQLKCRFTDPIAPGNHWLVIASRIAPGGNLLRCTHRITAIG